MSKRRKIVSNIVFYSLLVVIYSLAIFGIVNRFTGGVIYLGNTRFDIVLTDSMSSKNKHYEEFLENTTQIQAFDMVKSKKINDETELRVKDIVLFHNSTTNKTVVHRIVDIIEKGDKFKIDTASKVLFHDIDTVRLDLNGIIAMSELDFTSITIESYSESQVDPHFAIKVGSEEVDKAIEVEEIGNYYFYKTTFSRDNHTFIPSNIYCPGDYDEYISKITYYSASKGELVFEANEFNNEESGVYEYLYNKYYLYEIRADKSNTSDGTFKRSDIISKVDYVIPKMGHVVRFITSIPGVIMLVGIGVLISVASYFLSKNKKDEPIIENKEPNPTEPVDENKDKKE